MKSIHKALDKHDIFAQADTFSTCVDVPLPVHIHPHLSVFFACNCAMSNIPLGKWSGCMIGHTKCHCIDTRDRGLHPTLTNTLRLLFLIWGLVIVLIQLKWWGVQVLLSADLTKNMDKILTERPTFMFKLFTKNNERNCMSQVVKHMPWRANTAGFHSSHQWLILFEVISWNQSLQIVGCQWNVV